jgi:hypothetical protein
VINPTIGLSSNGNNDVDNDGIIDLYYVTIK